MSTNFDTSFMTGDPIEAAQVSQFAAPINNLENGSANFRNDTGTANSYKVDFSAGNEITSLSEGQMIVFKAQNANTGASVLTVTGPSGDLTPVAITKQGNTALVADDISADQVVSVVYVETGGTGRFEMATGTLGAQGPTGPQGPQGNPGPAGADERPCRSCAGLQCRRA